MEKVWIDGKNGSYIAHTTHGQSLGNLAEFLTDGGNMDWENDWIDDSRIDFLSGNSIEIIKQDNEIIITHQYFEGLLPFIISKQKLIKILNLWKKISPLKLARIDIMKENNKFIFEYDTPEGHQKIVVQ